MSSRDDQQQQQSTSGGAEGRITEFVPGEDVEDQTPSITLLLSSEVHGGCETVKHIETHTAHVFVSDNAAFKLERAVWFPFLDMSTVELRHLACSKEVTMNRRTAPDLYLGVFAVISSPAGLQLLPEPEVERGTAVVDWVVKMRPFNDDNLLSKLAERGELTATMIEALVKDVANLHNGAKLMPECGGASEMEWIITDNGKELEHFGNNAGIPVESHRELTQLSLAALEKCHDLLDKRQKNGHVRLCHGDLHLKNIVAIDGHPVIFDCIEFNDNLASVDVGYDLAFLLMDLDSKGFSDLANLALNTYLWHTGDYELVPLLPLFASCRAAIRAKVMAADPTVQRASSSSQLAAEARRYVNLALKFLRASSPLLLATAGEPACGKSTLARMLSSRLGQDRPSPVWGCIVLRTDVTRKLLNNVSFTDNLPQSAYSPEMTTQTYTKVLETAEELLKAGSPVIVDATLTKVKYQEAVEQVARKVNVPFVGLWMECPVEIRAQRAAARTGDASDADADVVKRLAGTADKPCGDRWHTIVSTGDPQDSLRDALTTVTQVIASFKTTER